MATACGDWIVVGGGTAALQAAGQRRASDWMRRERKDVRARRGEEDSRPGGKSTAAEGDSDDDGRSDEWRCKADSLATRKQNRLQVINETLSGMKIFKRW